MTAIELLAAFLMARTDTFPVLAPWETHCPANADDLPAVLATHVDGQAPEVCVNLETKRHAGLLLGRWRVGTYSLDKQGRARWICLDYDGGAEHANPLRNPTEEALRGYETAVRHGLPAYLERSGGGHGWHLWIFLAEPTDIKIARLVGLALCPPDAALANGGNADPLQGHGIEIYPKSFRGSPLGAAIWLPWWNRAPEGANQFYKPTATSLDLWLPHDFCRCTPAALEAAISSLPWGSHWRPASLALADRPTQADLTARMGAGASEGPSPQHPPPPDPTRVEGGAKEFTAWKDRALASAPLEQIYSPYLTGRSSSAGWLECRDPWSPTGDSGPSAGVADGTGEAKRGSFHSFRNEQTIDLFEYLQRQGLAASFWEACKYLSKLTGLPIPMSAGGGGRKAPPSVTTATAGGSQDPTALPADRRPMIVVTGQQLDALVAQSWKHLEDSNSPPRVFMRAGEMAVVRDFDATMSPAIQIMRLDGVTGLLARVIRWYRLQAEDKMVACIPPRAVAADMIALPDDDRLPILEAVSAAPVFAASGRLCDAEGYNPDSRTWYVSRGLVVPPIPTSVTEADVKGAVDFLVKDLLVDFPFATDSDRCHALGALLLPFLRPMIEGPTPLHTFESPTEGSGKGLLCDLLATTATGSYCAPQPLSSDPEEVRKQLFSCLLAGRPVIILDNANDKDRAGKDRRTISGGTLEAILTAPSWTDRLMGGNGMAEVKNRAVWFMTGVNLEYTKGIRRRRVRIRLEPNCENPYQRGRAAFKHPDILRWAKKHRPQIYHAVFILIQAWLDAGRPPANRELGSYESWAAIVGGVLENAGVKGWLEYLDDPSEYGVEEHLGEWHELVTRWYDLKKNAELTVSEIVSITKGNEYQGDEDLLRDIKGDGNSRSQLTNMTRALRTRRDQVFKGFKLTGVYRAHRKATVYFLSPLTNHDNHTGKWNTHTEVGQPDQTNSEK